MTLVDAWGPGHSRSSSGGDTRVTRQTYGDRFWAAMAGRALEQWREWTARWSMPVYMETGALFMARPEGHEFMAAAAAVAREASVEHEVLHGHELSRRFPQISFDDVDWALYEYRAGVLFARRSCQEVAREFIQQGGEIQIGVALPGIHRSGELTEVRMQDGTSLSADRYVFACGPWLLRLFPEVVQRILKVSRQEVFYFGPPAGETRYHDGGMPVWGDIGRHFWYGVPGSEYRGFKLADHGHGPPLDPTRAERLPTPDALSDARSMLEHRFPGMRGAPVVETRVCQYTSSLSEDFIVDTHPESSNVWLVGGGSGHGFKHGPALGELVAEQVLEERPPEPRFLLSNQKAWPERA